MAQGPLSEVGTVLPCVDIERSKSFYHDVLGLEIEETPGHLTINEKPGQVADLILGAAAADTESSRRAA